MFHFFYFQLVGLELCPTYWSAWTLSTALANAKLAGTNLLRCAASILSCLVRCSMRKKCHDLGFLCARFSKSRRTIFAQSKGAAAIRQSSGFTSFRKDVPKAFWCKYFAGITDLCP
jgi:hypothetical protein